MENIYSNKPKELINGILSLLFLVFFQMVGFSQNAGISPTGAIAPDPSAGLDVNFTTKGLLIPRIALTATTSFLPLASHVAGMVVYNTATTGDVLPGFYFNNGTKWVTIPTGKPGQLLQINSTGVPTWTGAGYATVATTVLSSITTATAVSGGNITSDAGSAVTARGV